MKHYDILELSSSDTYLKDAKLATLARPTQMKKYRISPRISSEFELPPFIEAESPEAAMDIVLRRLGYPTVDHFNTNQDDDDDYLSATEVLPKYIAALEVIMADPIMKDIPRAMLDARQEWEPTAATAAAIKRAVAASGAETPRRACNRIMGDMQEYGIPAGDWSWVPMMKMHGVSE